jgi:bacillithiol system protein YtxJ
MKNVFNEINTVEKLEEVFAKSNEKPVLLFKHSTACPISANIHQEIQNVATDKVNLVVVQTARDVSDEIATRTGIRHETPQAIVLKDGKAIYHAAHYDVTADEVSEKLKVKSE